MQQLAGRLRNSLERNKIFFETVAAVLLSLMAVVIATVQTTVAAKQTVLLELQTRIAEVQVLPQFALAAFVSNEGHRSWVVRNGGAPIHDLEFSAASFLTVVSHVPDLGLRTIELPFHYGLGSWFASSGGSGDIANVSGFQTVGEFESLRERIVQSAQSRGWKSTRVELHVVVRLRFRDLLDRRREAFYRAVDITDGHAMADDAGRALFSSWDTEPHLTYFDTPERVLDSFLERARSRQGTPFQSH